MRSARRAMSARMIVVLSIGASLAACGASDAPSDAGPAPLDARLGPHEAFVGPARLSETGLYRDLASGALADGVLEYEVRFELWADEAEKRRFLWLPPGETIDTRDPDRWVFPVGTRAWKELRIGGRAIETRFLVKVEPGRWENVAYVWREDGSDADARPEGAPDALGTAHDVPNVEGCFDCHRGSDDGLLGVSAIQLARGEGDLLSRLAADARLTHPIAEGATAIPGDAITQAALGYLHGNCGSCHRDAHPLSRQRALRLDLRLGLRDVSETQVMLTAPGAPAHHESDGTTQVLVPGEPDASQLWTRMRHRGDVWAMPSRGSEQVDEAGVEAVRQWIAAQ